MIFPVLKALEIETRILETVGNKRFINLCPYQKGEGRYEINREKSCFHRYHPRFARQCSCGGSPQQRTRRGLATRLHATQVLIQG